MTGAHHPGSEAAREAAGRESADAVAAREAAAQEAIRTGNTVPEPSVTWMFDSIAPIYDRMNTLMTAGMDGGWRRVAVRAANLSKGGTALDVACGTGKLTAALAVEVGPEGRVVGVDLSPVMLDQARRAFGRMPGVEFVLGNALSLPVADGSFDATTIAFGLRNLSSFEDGFREMKRAVRSGGRVVCLELSVPRPRFMGRVYVGLFRITAPVIGALFRRRAAYAYLPSSLRGFPPAEEIAATMRRVGLEDVKFKRMALGSVALHWGTVA